jgi:hypothetical protein
MKIIPPAYSHFHATISNASRIKDGIRWITKALSCFQIASPGSKASSANILTNIIARIHKIRGIQCIAWVDFFMADGFCILKNTFILFRKGLLYL